MVYRDTRSVKDSRGTSPLVPETQPRHPFTEHRHLTHPFRIPSILYYWSKTSRTFWWYYPFQKTNKQKRDSFLPVVTFQNSYFNDIRFYEIVLSDRWDNSFLNFFLFLLSNFRSILRLRFWVHSRISPVLVSFSVPLLTNLNSQFGC